MLATWRSFLTSDHFYYMCTKYAADGDVHKYFNPYNNPYEAYINYQNIICDFALDVAAKKKQLSQEQEVVVEEKPRFASKLLDFFHRGVGVVYE